MSYARQKSAAPQAHVQLIFLLQILLLLLNSRIKVFFVFTVVRVTIIRVVDVLLLNTVTRFYNDLIIMMIKFVFICLIKVKRIAVIYDIEVIKIVANLVIFNMKIDAIVFVKVTKIVGFFLTETGRNFKTFLKNCRNSAHN